MDETGPPILSYGTAGYMKLVTVAFGRSEFEAELIRGRLLADGIRSYAHNGGLGTLHPAMRVNGFPIQVEAQDVDAAVAILRDTPAGKTFAAEGVAEPTSRPRRAFRKWFVIASVLCILIGVMMIAASNFLGVPICLVGLLAAAIKPAKRAAENPVPPTSV